jgi:hypothetical protein
VGQVIADPVADFFDYLRRSKRIYPNSQGCQERQICLDSVLTKGDHVPTNLTGVKLWKAETSDGF